MDDGNSALFQGTSNIGTGIAQAINNYRQYKERSANAEGAIAAGLQNNQDALMSAPEDIQKLLKKHSMAETGYTDKLKLAGYFSSYGEGKKQKLANDAASQQNKEFQDQKAEQDAMKAKLARYGGYASGVGKGILNQATQASIQDPRMQDAISNYQTTGTVPTQQTMAQMATNRATNEARMQAAALRGTRGANGVEYIDQTGPDGKPYKVSVDKATGQELGRIEITAPKMIHTPAEEIAIAGGKAGADDEAKRAGAYLDSISSGAEAAQAPLEDIQRIKDLYATAGAKSGAGQDFMTQAGAWAVHANLLPAEKQATQEELQALMAKQSLSTAREYLKGEGSVDKNERALVEKASANLGRTPEANLNMVNLTHAILTRRTAAEQERRRLVDSDMPAPKIAEQLKRWHADNPISKFAAGKVDAAAPADPQKKPKYSIVEVK